MPAVTSLSRTEFTPPHSGRQTHPQLRAIWDEFATAQERLHALAESVPEEWWAVRHDPARWSVGECVAHLNLTAEAYLPLVRRGIEEGRALEIPAPSRHRRDPLGWLLWRTGGRRCVIESEPPRRSCHRAWSRGPTRSSGSTAFRRSRPAV